MDLHGGWRSMSGKTMLFVVLGAAYYLALNAILINEIIECARKPRRHDIESVGRTHDKPLLESCRDLFRCTAEQAVSHGAGGNIAQLTQRQVLSLRQCRQGRSMAAHDCGFGQVGDRAIQIIA